jgi:Family of unknown function (DUF5519)
MFDFVVKFLGFLKNIPLLPQVFESGLKVATALTAPKVLTYMDEIEAEVESWEKTSISNHKYGGIQFNKDGAEIGHIHGNGLLDIPFNKKTKNEFIKEGKLKDHHIFKNSGWSSFYIHTNEDKDYAIKLLRESYLMRK